MKKVGVVTATRAEYGLLKPLIRRLLDDTELELRLYVTGTHLSDRYGTTVAEIEKDGIPITDRIPILEQDNTSYGVSLTMANAIRGFASCFREDPPDMIVILGDRTEMLGVAASAMNACIPIAHIHGGEVTAGAVDDCVRHALTKIGYLHFTSTQVYRNRVIQMGEAPERVYDVGSLGTENILHQKLYSEREIRVDAGLPEVGKYAIATFHPVTLEADTAIGQVRELCAAMEERKDIFFLVTAANADADGDRVNGVLREYCEVHENARFVFSLGSKRYLSAVKYAAFVIGNSSSGILEAPVLGTPTVNIGDRQNGRLMTETILNVMPDRREIVGAMENAEKMLHRSTDLYGDGTTSEKIVNVMKDWLMNGRIDLKKGFFDL